MTDQLISNLEAAAGIVMASPDVVTNEQRHAAESIFMDFRKSKSPFNLCKEILDRSQNQYVLFEAAEVLKNALIREWSFLLESDKLTVRQYLLQFITNRDVPSFVRDRIIQVVVIMVKRASVDDGGEERSKLLQDIENLIVNEEPKKKIIGCNIISNLMQEYANTIKSSDVGLAWEVHFRAKKQFEATDLKRIFQFCIYLLSEIVRNDPPYPDNIAELTGHLLRICESVLTWGSVSSMLPKRLIGIYESVVLTDRPPALRLTEDWADIIFNPDLLPLMFQVYWKVRNVEQLLHPALTCLGQLASLSGGIVANDDLRLKYLHTYLVSFFDLISDFTIRKTEALGIASITRKLAVFFVRDMMKLPSEMQDNVIYKFTRLTCTFCEGSIEEEAQNDDNKYYCEAFDTILEAWTTILVENNFTVENELRESSVRIFNKYVHCHLALPDGARLPSINQDEENEDNDRTKYKDQLQTIGMFGRAVAFHSLPAIVSLLERRLQDLSGRIEQLQMEAMNISTANHLENLFEDIHWLLLIAGHVLCMESDGETPMIPAQIMQLSIEQYNRNETDLFATQATLRSVDENFKLDNGVVEKCDPVLRILYMVLKLSNIQEFAVRIKKGQFFSPEVGSSIMWFFQRFTAAYLFPTESFYHETSPILFYCLGIGTESAHKIIGSVVGRVQSNLIYYQSEPILLRDSTDAFCTVATIGKQNNFIAASEGMMHLLTFFEQLEPGVLPQNVLQGLCRGFALAGSTLSTPNDIRKFYNSVLTPISRLFNSLISNVNIKKECHKEEIQKVLIHILEAVSGLAKGCVMSTVGIMFELIVPLLEKLPLFLQLYNNYQVIVQLILEVFGQCAKAMLCYLSPTDSRRLYECIKDTIKIYSKCNKNRLSTEVFSEDSSFQDLALVLDLLTYVLSKDCIDLSDAGDVTVTASDVALYGLSFIMPLMSLELLKFPNLCTQYYHLLVLINEIYPEKIAQLPQHMLLEILHLIEIGLTQFGTDVCQTCLDFISSSAAFIFKRALRNDFVECIKKFLELLMDLTLTHQINSDLMTTAGITVYSLICCFPNEYQMLVQRLIQLQTDPLIADRLTAAFNNLTLNVAWTFERQPKLKFRDNFEKFISNVHGFLLVK